MGQFLICKTRKCFAGLMLGLACWFLLGVTVVAFKSYQYQLAATNEARANQVIAKSEVEMAEEAIENSMPVEKTPGMLKNYAVAQH